MRVRKILIVENFSHLWQVQGVIDLFSPDYECDVFISKRLNKTYKLNKKIILSRFDITLLFEAFLLAKNYDYIYLNSSPEYPDYPKNFKSLIIYIQQMISLFLFSIFYRDKLIIYLRGVYRILPELQKKNKFFYWLRKKVFLFFKRFAFENDNLADKFNKLIANKSKKEYLITTIYTRFNYSNKIEKKTSGDNDKLCIGILGSIDPIRKDYEILENFVNKNKDEIKLIFLGRFLDNLSEKVIDKFKECELIYKDFLDSTDFKKLGNECDVLLSLNKEEKYYGDYKGTGSFGDAIQLQKKLIAPLFSDKIKEFKDFTLYYNQIEDLEKLLEKFKKEKRTEIINFEKFKIENCRNRVIFDLKLN